jgi:hypothetical protein
VTTRTRALVRREKESRSDSLAQPALEAPSTTAFGTPAPGVGHEFGNISILPKLEVSAPGDAYEREADQAAASVVAQFGTGLAPPEPPPPQSPDADGGFKVDAHTERHIESARGGGARMPGGVQGKMEHAFGVDFSAVRVHADGTSDSLNRSLGARAFTTQSDIFFRSGEYHPESASGQELLAHELTHVVQQTGEVSPKRIQRESAPSTSAGPNASVAPPEKKYNLTLSTGTFNDLSETQALLKLAEAYTTLEHAVDAGRGEHGIVFGMRSEGFFNAIGALLTEITGEKFPDMGIWDDASRLLVRAHGDLIGRRPEAAALDLLDAKTAYDKASKEWEAFKNQMASAETKAYIAIGVTAVVIIAVAAIAVVVTPVAAVGGGAVAGAEGGGAVAGGAVVGAEGGAVASATIPEVAIGVGETLPGAGAGVASETGPLIFQELLAIYRAAGPLAMRAAARGMSVEALEKLLTFITVKLIGAGPLSQREVTIVDEIYEIILLVWQQKIGLPGTAPP